MKSIVLSLLLVVICSEYVCSQVIEPNCTSDDNCDRNNKLECIQGKCRCKIGYRKGNGPSCILVVGTSCQANDECENFPGSFCDNFKCACEHGFIAGQTECNQVGNRGDPCTSHNECVQRIKDDNIECKAGSCVCKPSYHENSQLKCVQTFNLGDSCSSDDNCHLIVNDKNSLQCNSGICKCKEGYIEKEDTCSGSTTIFTLSIGSLLILALNILKI